MLCPQCHAQIAYRTQIHACPFQKVQCGDPPPLKGLNYGMTVEQTERVMRKAGITQEDAQKLLGEFHERYPVMAKNWGGAKSPEPSKREVVELIRKRSVRYLEENPDPDPPQTAWCAFWEGFLHPFDVLTKKPDTVEETLNRVVATMSRSAAEATVQVCDDLLKELDD